MKEFRWFAVYTLPKWERKVAEILERKGIQAYCPLVKSNEPWENGKKSMLKPLFPNYVFVYLQDDQHLSVARQAKGVTNFLYWLGSPVTIADEEIEAIKLFLNDYQYIKAEKIPININDKVSMINEPIILKKGNVVEIKSNMVKVNLPSIGWNLLAEVRKGTKENFIFRDKFKSTVEAP